MIIFWRGRGFLVLVITFGISLINNLITDSITGNATYYKVHKWPVGISLIISGALCWLAGEYLNNKQGRVLVDPTTGQQVVLRRTHSLFFIPLMWWGPILGVIGAGVVVAGLLK